MTYKAIQSLSGHNIYLVSTQEEANKNPTLEYVVGAEQDLLDKLKQIQDEYLLRDSYRFSCNKEVVDGSNTTWCGVDFDTDPEVGVYWVFNHFTGLHEKVESLTAARDRVEALKQETLVWAGLTTVQEIDFLPELVSRPDNIPVAGL